MAQQKKVDNFKTAAKLTVLFGVLAIVAVVSLIFALTSAYMHKIYYWIIFFVAFIAYLLLWLIKPYYVGIYEDRNSLSIRFYFVHPFLFNYSQIKFNKNELYDYQIKTRLFGLLKHIVIYTKKGREIWKYPPISLSAVSKSELSEMKKLLDSLKIKKQ